MKTRFRIFRAMSAVLTVVLLFAFVALISSAGESEYAEGRASFVPEVSELDEDLFAGYVEKQMYQGGVSVFASSHGENVLTGTSLRVYRELKTALADIAAKGGSTVVNISKEAFGSISVGYSQGQDPRQVIAPVLANALNFQTLMNCLLIDCPYELYWFDKTEGMSFSFGYLYDGHTVEVESLSIIFRVSSGYRAPDYNADSPAMTTSVSAVNEAVNEAKRVVLENAGKGDAEKLAAYRDYIIDAVSYNFDAISETVVYGDPWQLVYVFDRNADTNVVCEGYSKAFSYLCELSEFEGDVTCYLMTGLMNNGAHMWNVVAMNGTNYLADLTNSELGTIGQGGELFMNSRPTFGNANGYDIQIPNNPVSYVYDAVTLALFPESVRTLGTEAYTVSGSYTVAGDAAEPVYFELMQGGTVMYDTFAVGNSGTYSIPEVVPGTYTLVVTKADHITEEYEVTVTDAAVTQDVFLRAMVFDEAVKFNNASLILYNNLTVTFKVKKALIGAVEFDDLYAVFEFDGKEIVIDEYSENDTHYIFEFSNVYSYQMNETIYATLYAETASCVKHGAVVEYSVAKYCYDMLSKEESTTKLKTMLVDILNYGAASQIYFNKNTDNLANANLTPEQQALATQDRALANIADKNHQVVEAPEATWKFVSLYLMDSICVNYKFTASDVTGLTLKITNDSGEEWIIPAEQFTFSDDDGLWVASFSDLMATQLSASVYATLYRGEEAVSNTLKYSVESYATTQQGSDIAGIEDLTKCIVKYGDSAYAYFYQ